jgi:hypothetical protein
LAKTIEEEQPPPEVADERDERIAELEQALEAHREQQSGPPEQLEEDA